MKEISGAVIRTLAEAAASSDTGGRAPADLLAALDSAPSPEIALLDTFAALMERIANTYFNQPWNEEHQFNVFARLTNDSRAWGYGSDDEVEPLRWLWQTTGLWFDGTRLRGSGEWLAEFEVWAEGQRQLVRRMTPGALNPDSRLAR